MADALSRKHNVMASLMVREWKSLKALVHFEIHPIQKGDKGYIGSLIAQPTLVGKIRQMQMSDESLACRINDLIMDLLDECPTDWSVDTEGSLCFRGRLCVPDLEELKKEVLDEAHRSRYTIHPGGTKMYHDLKRTFWWEGMKRDVGEYVSKCIVYQ